MVFRVFVEKKQGLQNESMALAEEFRSVLQIPQVESVRIFQRYDVENISAEIFDCSVKTILSEPQLDHVFFDFPETQGEFLFGVEPLPGQFDQRADSAAQCIQILSQEERPLVRTAKIYLVAGTFNQSAKLAMKKHVINTVESREASLSPLKTLEIPFIIPQNVKTLDGFSRLDEDGLVSLLKTMGLAMDLDDLRVCRDYFASEHRDPTMTEIRVIDTYWSDHCRHTTFLTTLDKIHFEDSLLEETFELYCKSREDIGRTKPINLMDMGTMAARFLSKTGKLSKLDESEEINACTVKIIVNTEDGEEDWLLLFKNETHNHPTEIEPFGGAATCIGGAIRDPLSGRSYVYGAMRVTGAANPLVPVQQTRSGKLPQRTIVTKSAAGYSSYGNQIGLATGQVDEIYHQGYEAKRMEIGAVIGAVPAENVRRECPNAGDVVILLGGRTGRDGCGGATGSSKAHTTDSLETCGAEVQKGNAPEERKLQRLFRNPKASKLIKRCNDFGAGGVAVAIGELADGLVINLDNVPKKYEGLDGTELAISESQERIAVVVEEKDSKKFMEMATAENIESHIVAIITDEARLIMQYKGVNIVNIARSFLSTNGAEKHMTANVEAAKPFDREPVTEFTKGYMAIASDLNVCSKRGLAERFDSSIGSGTVLMPFGGKYQRTPTQAMVHKICVEKRDTDTCSFMSWGANPYIMEQSPYHGAYFAVIESVCKLVATGATLDEMYLTFQEYFPRLGHDESRWGQPVAALLGAFRAQMELGIAAIGGKDSMSGSFEELDVPPTLVSFAVTTGKLKDVISPEFKQVGSKVIWLRPTYGADGLTELDSLKKVIETVNSLCSSRRALAVYTPTYGGLAEAVLKMSMGNGLGFAFDKSVDTENIFSYQYGSFLVEVTDGPDIGVPLGVTTQSRKITHRGEEIEMSALISAYENKLEPVYRCNVAVTTEKEIPAFASNNVTWHVPSHRAAKPRVLIPVFPGTNCEYDAAKAIELAGGEAEIVVIQNRTSDSIIQSINYMANRIKDSQIIFIPGGFSGGDEPDGSGKFITSFFRNGKIAQEVNELLKNRDGLICGICNGFQALIKLGLVPYGEIMDTDENCPTLTFNTIGRHQSKMCRTRIASNRSPWLMQTKVDDIYTVPISHGEGRFLGSEDVIAQMARNGQIATQYVDLDGNPTYNIDFNPNNSAYAIEGITSPDGRVFGKMGHSERIGKGLYQNVAGIYEMDIFSSAVMYFK